MKNLMFCFSLIFTVFMSCKDVINIFKEQPERIVFESDTIVSPIEGYTLKWSDEFNGNKLDSARWKYRIGISHESSQRPENVYLDSGKLHIQLKRENHAGKSLTGGGVITKTGNGYGYYEVRAKLDGGYGWHEAFWTSGQPGFDSPYIMEDSAGMVEIDCFEHFFDYNGHRFSFGTHEWLRYPGQFNRGEITTVEDLNTSYNVYGFEYTPDYLNYYFNGRLLETVDMRNAPIHDFFLWLSAIATKTDAVNSGLVSFDYIRAFEINSAAYNLRKVAFLSQLDSRLDSINGTTSSAGIDLWVQAEDFVKKGGWKAMRDSDNLFYLRGHTFTANRTTDVRTAQTAIAINNTSTYHVWVRSKDYLVSPGIRNFKVFINGVAVSPLFGTHGQDGYHWQYAGAHVLSIGNTVIKMYDQSQYFARCDKFLLTTDPNFTPDGAGGVSNVQHINLW